MPRIKKEEAKALLSETDERPSTPQHSQEPQFQEDSPLLPSDNQSPRYDGRSDRENHETSSSPAAASLASLHNGFTGAKRRSKKPWAVIIAIVLLVITTIVIGFAAFIVPSAVEDYAKQALVIEPTGLSIDSFTANGVRARIRANFKLDAARVENKDIRNIGRLGTWVAREVESQPSKLQVYLPEYDNLLLGSASIPSVVVSIRNGETTHIDLIADLVAGEVDGIKRIANDWLEGRLGSLRVQGKANVALKSGIFPLGTTSISESMTFEGSDIPSIPAYNISSLNFQELPLPDGSRGVAADASLTIFNKYPVALSIPSLGFDILLPSCKEDESPLRVADATTQAIDVRPESDVEVRVGALVTQLSDEITKLCPESTLSPLDQVLAKYISGKDVTIYVRGSNAPSANTPSWITDIVSSITVPIPFPGHEFNDAIKNFTLENVHFGLPNPFADPGSPDADYRVSGNIKVIAALPKEMNFNLNVSQVRANANVYYKGKKLGFLDLKKWQAAESHRLPADNGGASTIMIESRIEEAPLRITNQDVFSDMMGEYLLGGKTLILTIKAMVDINVNTVLGNFVIRDLPGEGKVPVKASDNHSIETSMPRIGGMDVIDTSSTSLTLEARVNFTNPTPYSATIPYASVHVEVNGSVLVEGIVRDIQIVPGNNTNILARAVLDPQKFGGKEAAVTGREFLSQYLSGYNTTITLRTHTGSIPSQPGLGAALAKYNITIPTPQLFKTPQSPDDDDSDPDDSDGDGGSPSAPKPHFIRDATFHLLSSTATFTLLSPLKHTSIYIEHINATALYNHTEPIGRMVYDYPFKVVPGASTSPKLPVDWSLGSVGYGKVRDALGGTLKLDATAVVSVRLGRWREVIWYKGGGIGASIRL